jgi:class 3 adenylate cyclase
MSPNPPQDDSRTLMAAVLFADLVGYSRKPVADQFAAKESFRELLQGVLAPLAPTSRMVLDTGDGAAIAFLADPEHALYVVLELRAVLASGASGSLLGSGDLRLGINLGPVKRMVDINGQPNLVGEGMNTAERVMSFASPGEITASRAYCDAISCLRESYRFLFESLGRRTDKHGREHEVFRLCATPRALEEARSSVGFGEVRTPAQAPDHSPSSTGGPQVGWRALVWAALVVVVALGGTAVAWRANKGDPAAAHSRPDAAPGQVPDAKPPVPAPIVATDKSAVESSVDSTSAKSLPAVPTERAPDPAPAPLHPETPALRERPVPGDSSRCAALTQRAALGEVLNSKDQEALRRSCR